jgi:hypothetical protein
MTAHNKYIPLTYQIVLRDAFYQNDLAMRNTADVEGGKPIAVWLQSISGALSTELQCINSLETLTGES